MKESSDQFPRVVGRLVLDQGLRRAFSRDPHGALRRFGLVLDGEDVERLIRLMNLITQTRVSSPISRALEGSDGVIK